MTRPYRPPDAPPSTVAAPVQVPSEIPGEDAIPPAASAAARSMDVRDGDDASAAMGVEATS
jgi:hypothetical protein